MIGADAELAYGNISPDRGAPMTVPEFQSPLFGGIATWLLERGLLEASVGEIAQGLGRRLVNGGVSLHRISIGGVLLHPVFGGMDVVWEARNDRLRSDMYPRSAMNTAEFQDAPFFHMLANGIPFMRSRLEDGELEHEFPIFERLRDQGVTDYLAFFHTYGRKNEVQWADLPPGMEGAISSFSTRRIGGFTDVEIAYLRALATPLALAIKATTTYELAKTLLDTYLGSYSGGQVLEGLVERGHGKLIDCALWYCDLRDSTAMADQLSIEDYLEAINAYFDCTAGAVLDHGGEVLKFIGDAVMAIFPFEDATRPAVDMCRAAAMTTREAFSKATTVNAGRAEKGHAPISFGVSLHVGQVMYGNVGTAQRLDFTVTGPAANEAVRLEGLCKSLGTSVIASSRFEEICPEELIPLGVHQVAGVDGGLAAFTLADFAPGPEPPGS